jgi:TRAP-type C4-dicarboxylate transport system permease small subunit
MNRLNALNQHLVRIEKAVACFLVAGIAICVFLQVLFRYVLESPLAWTDELSRYLQVWMVFVGAAIATEQSSHFHLDLIHQYVTPAAARWVEIGSLLTMFAFAAVLVVYGTEILEIVDRQSSPAMGVPMSYPYAATPIGSTLICWHILVRLIGKFSAPTNEAAPSR